MRCWRRGNSYHSSIVGRAMRGYCDERRIEISVLCWRKSLQPGHCGPAAHRRAKWAPRTELGWQFDHFIGYFGITLFFCFAWPRPLVVGGIIMAVAASLESLRALTPDRSANLEAALWGAGGALAGALVAKLFIRAWRWRLKSARSAKVFPQKSSA
jgi:VanZ family protein